MLITAQVVPTAPRLSSQKDSEEVRKSLLNLAAQINDQLNRLDDNVIVAQVNSDWDALSGPAFILNKPDLLELGETSTMAYRGDRGKTAYDHSQTTGNPHGATQDDIPDGITYAQFSILEQTKLSGIEAGAQVNVKADWTALSGDSEILNKPDLSLKADLVAGKVPASQLPAYVDDVIEVANYAALPVTGENGKIYVTLDTNLTYRWTGTTYVEISASLALGETSSTAYRGDRGKAAYDHSQIVTGNPHGSTQDDIGNGTTYKQYSQTEKTKLAGIEPGAQVNVPTDLSLGTRTATGIPVNSSTGADVTLPVATTTLAGLESAADKTKLDGIAAGAEVNVQSDWNAGSGDAQILNKPAALSSIGSLTPAADRLPYYTSASAAALATFTAFARTLLDDADAATMRSTLGALAAASYTAADVLTKLLTVDTDTAGINATTIKSVTPGAGGLLLLALSALSSLSPSMNGTATPGTSNIPSRQDHIHPVDTSRAPIDSPFFGSASIIGASITSLSLNYLASQTISSSGAIISISSFTRMFFKITSASSIIIYLDSTLVEGTRLVFRRTVSSANSVTLTPNGGDTIEGDTSFVIMGSKVSATLDPTPITIEKVSATAWKFVDGIISGEVSNRGWYRKYSNGILEQNYRASYAQSLGALTWTFPSPYLLNDYTLNVSPENGSSPSDCYSFFYNRGVSTVDVYLRGTAWSTQANYVNMACIGKWR